MKYLALVLLALVAFAGCVKSPIEGRADPYIRQQIHFADFDLANKTAVSPPIMERRNGLLYVTVPLRSAWDLDLHVDYRVTFFNEAGVPIEGPTSWTGAHLVSNIPSSITVNSLTPNAADFQMDLRYPR
jgi:uncharacterized protein YcfL